MQKNKRKTNKIGPYIEKLSITNIARDQVIIWQLEDLVIALASAQKRKHNDKVTLCCLHAHGAEQIRRAFSEWISK